MACMILAHALINLTIPNQFAIVHVHQCLILIHTDIMTGKQN